jgi:hypothetical protein
MKNTPVESSGKSAHNVIIFVLLATVACTAVWIVKLQGRLAVVQQELDAIPKGPAPVSPLVAENQALRDQVAALQSKIAATPVAPAPMAPTASPMNAAVTAMMSNPAVLSAMTDATKRSVERRFADLFTQLGLSPEDRAKLVDLLVQKQSAPRDATAKLMAGNLDTSQRTALIQQMKDDSANAEASVKDFLGEANYAQYQDYVHQQAETARATALNAQFAQSGEPLSPDQSSSLKSLMDDERRNFTFTADLGANDVDPAAVLNGPAVDTYLTESEELSKRITDRAASILTPTQLAVFQKNQANQLQMRKSTMNLARQLMGGALPASK